METGDKPLTTDSKTEVQPQPANTIANVPQIREGSGVNIARREDFQKYVEAPLLQACLGFYDKNVRTFSTSANGVNNSLAGISIDFDSLSVENQKIAQELGKVSEYRGERFIALEREITPDTSVDEIEKWSLELAKKFKRQPMTWAPIYTREQVEQLFGASPSESIKQIEADNNLYYDSDNNVFFLSEEHARKFKEDLKVDWDQK